MALSGGLLSRLTPATERPRCLCQRNEWVNRRRPTKLAVSGEGYGRGGKIVWRKWGVCCTGGDCRVVIRRSPLFGWHDDIKGDGGGMVA